jgi:hypothetical protein
MTAIDALNLFSRKYRHEVLGVNYYQENAPQYIVDQDFIPRRITSAVVVFEGVKAGCNPLHTIMWTALGYPACAVAVPLLVHGAHLPYYMLARDTAAAQANDLHSEMCDASLRIKDQWAFPMHISNGKRYVALQTILVGNETKPALMTCTNDVETKMQSDFLPLYQQWTTDKISDEEFWQSYDHMANRWMQTYYDTFQPYLSNEK